MTSRLSTRSRGPRLAVCLVLLLLPVLPAHARPAVSGERAFAPASQELPPLSPEALTRVATAIQAEPSSDPGALLRAVKAASPDRPAIATIRELNKALEGRTLPAEVQTQREAIIRKQKAAQRVVRERVLAVRNGTYDRYRSSNQAAFRSVYGHGDIGSWPGASDPDASMDIDWTVFGTDPDVTAELRDACKADLLRNLAGEDSGLTLADFDVVITAEGHERAAGVFETEGGIDWAKRNMKRVTIVQPDGRTRTYELGTGDPIGELAQAEHMAKFRDMASKNGDYEKLFDTRGFLKAGLFDNTDSAEAQALWNRYMDMLSGEGIDFYRSRSSTATGGCLDMAKHLQEEVISKKHESKAKLKKTLKYVARADNISRGVPGLDRILASDPLLSDPAYRDMVDLANRIGRASNAEVDAIIKERFGDMPDAGLQELGNKARRGILRMSEVAFQAEMDRIILETPDKAGRKSALDKLTDDFRIVADEGGEYSDTARSAVEQISKIQDANDAGTIDQIRQNYQSLERIRRADQGLISQTREFMQQTVLGRKLLDAGGKVLEIGNRPVFEPATGKFQSAAADFVNDLVDSTRAKGLTVVQVLGSAAMWSEVINSVRTARSNADLAIALGKTLINNTFFGMVLNSAYAGIVMGDNDALGKAVMYMLVPEAALPALVEALGNTVISMGAQTLFDAQMEAVYKATTFKDGEIENFGGTEKGGAEGARLFIDTMCDGAPEEVAQDFVSKTKASDTGNGLNAIGIKAVAKSIRSTVDNGNVLVYAQDGPLRKAAAAIAALTADIADCGKAWGVEVALSAATAGDLPSGLDRAQTQALVTLMKRREQLRLDARAALTAAIVRTFEERNRAEGALDSGKAKAEYDALLKIFEQLNIVKEGQQSLEEEGAPYNLLSSWLTSTREKQVTAVKAVQRFTDAYTSVLQARARAEEAASLHLGDAYAPDPRPLTGALPLTAKPDIDTRIAAAYLSEVGKIAEPLTFTMEAIKHGKLDGPYDEEMFRKIYEVRFTIAHASAMMKGASEAQTLHWAVEIFDKQALYGQHTKWAAEASDLQKQDAALMDEFRAHYTVAGAFLVDLTGPTEVTSGSDASLVASVGVKGQAGDIQPVPPDIAKQFRYAWASGKASLGDGPEPSKTYRLDTVGTHTFTVRVTQTEVRAGKPVTTDVGEKSWPVKVVAASGEEKSGDPPKDDKPAGEKPKDDKPGEKPKDEKPGEKPKDDKPGEKPKDDKPGATPPAAAAPPPGATSPPASGAKGYWKLGGVSDSKREGVSDIPLLSPQGTPAVVFAAGSMTSRVTGTYAVANTPGSSSGGYHREPFEQKQVTTWSDPPQVIVPGITYSTTLKMTWSPEKAPAETATMMLPGSMIDVSTKAPSATAQWSVDRPEEFTLLTGQAWLSVQVSAGGPGGVGRRTYNYTWEPGPVPAGAAPPATPMLPLTVTVLSDKPVPKLLETVTLSAAARGGVPPYLYTWSGASKGTGAALPFVVSKPGRNDFTVTVTDGKGATASAPFSVELLAVKVTLSAASRRVKLGQTLSFQAQVSSPGSTQPPAGLIYRWQPNPEVAFAPFEGPKSASTGKFSAIGKVKVWVEVMQKAGTASATLGESEQIEIEVLPPDISLRVFPAEPYPGQIVRVTASEDPTAGDAISYWWEYTGSAINPGPEANQRVYSFRPKDTTPVTVTAHGKAKDGGTDLGMKDLIVTPKAYDVTVTGPTARGPKPQIWDPRRMELVDADRQIAVFQDISVRVDVSPAPLNTPLRYQWALAPDGCSLGNPVSQEPTINCSQTGSYTATVTVTDNLGARLGSGSGPFAVTISQADLNGGQRQADAAKAEQAARQKAEQELAARREKAQQLRAEGQALQQQGKLREAIAKYRESLKFVPDAALEAHIAQIDAEAARLEQAAKAEQAAQQRAQQDLAANREKARVLRAEGQALQQQGKLREAIAKYSESLTHVPDAALEAYIAQVEAEAARQEQAAKQQAQDEQAKRDRAGQLRAEGQALQQQGKLRDAIAKYRESLTYVTDAALVAYIGQVEAEAARQEQAAKQQAQADQAKRDKARQLRADGQALQQEGKLRDAIAKYRESLTYVPDADLEAYIAQAEAAAARQEQAAKQQAQAEQAKRDKARQLRADGQALQQQGRLREAIAKYRESLTYVPDADLEAYIAQAEAAAAKQEQAAKQQEQAAKQQAAGEQASRDRARQLRAEGQALQQQGKWREAIAKYRESLKHVPDAALEDYITQLQAEGEKRERTAAQAAAAPPPAAAPAKPAPAPPPTPTPTRPPAATPPPSTAPAAPPASPPPPVRKAPPAEAPPPATSAPPTRPSPPPAPEGCTLTGDYSYSAEGATMTLSLRQSGGRVDGTMNVKDPSMGVNETVPVQGSLSGSDVRLTATRPDGTMTMAGPRSGDCRSLSLAVTIDGETQNLVFRRR
jgi:tetratricopeptide (TPR) repeat protein